MSIQYSVDHITMLVYLFREDDNVMLNVDLN